MEPYAIARIEMPLKHRFRDVGSTLALFVDDPNKDLLDLVLDLLADHRVLAISVVNLDFHLIPQSRSRTHVLPRGNKHRKQENNIQHMASMQCANKMYDMTYWWLQSNPRTRASIYMRLECLSLHISINLIIKESDTIVFLIKTIL